MRVFTEGRLAAYERMMQDYGDRNRRREYKDQKSTPDKPKKVTAEKVGGSHGSDKS